MFLGIDLGSSSIKLSLYDPLKGHTVGSISHPKIEMGITSPKSGWAEQNPEDWWEKFLEAYEILIKQKTIDTKLILGIGISYQMHGLVVVDKTKKLLRPSIIWCDSRAVDLGERAFRSIGQNHCLTHLLNSPGNFTASKLAWVKNNEPEIFDQIHKIMLPGDYFVMKLTGEITTTKSGLSEGIFWDYENECISEEVLNVYDISKELIPEIVPSIGSALKVQKVLATKLGLNEDVKITYRAGDQPNNAFSLNVLNEGEIAATAGTSGVIYAVSNKKTYDIKSRINTFVHVNDAQNKPSNGVLICVNGTGILYSWLKKLLNTKNLHIDYAEMNEMVKSVPVGAEGLLCLPFGNGSERIFENKLIGSHLLNLDFNKHETGHMLRAAVEGIIYALNLGFEMLSDLNINRNTIRAGNANLFLSDIFKSIFANVTDTPLEIFNTDGANGAARGAALGFGIFETMEEAFDDLQLLEVIEPNSELCTIYKESFEGWKETISKHSFIDN
jgi:xylulokinase